MNSPLKSNRGSHEKTTSKEVVFSAKFALRRAKLAMPAKFTLQAKLPAAVDRRI
jgi:hypothetical protein